METVTPDIVAIVVVKGIKLYNLTPSKPDNTLLCFFLLLRALLPRLSRKYSVSVRFECFQVDPVFGTALGVCCECSQDQNHKITQPFLPAQIVTIKVFVHSGAMLVFCNKMPLSL